MNQAPVLTKKQQNSALSSKKVKKKETIKNVLATPFKKHWPVMPAASYGKVKDLLVEHLPRLIPPKLKIPYKELKRIPKSERQAFRKKLLIDALSERVDLRTKYERRDGLALGVNDVTIALENQTASQVLITADVLPRLMVQHVIDQAVSNYIPVFVMPQLRYILKDQCGIGSIAIAFLNNNKYSAIQDKLNELHRYSTDRGENIETIDLSNSIEIMESTDADFMVDTFPELEVIKNKKQTVEEVNYEEDMIENEYKPQTPIDMEADEFSVYLMRTDKTKRVFVPEEREVNRDLVRPEIIAFTDTKEIYKGLHIHKIKQDPNRSQKKLAKIQVNSSKNEPPEAKYSLS